MSLEKKLKTYLTKEASCRVENFPLKKIPVTNAAIKQSFLEEAVNRLIKSGMAFGLNYGSLHTDTWNLEWDFPDIGPRSQAIRKSIEDNFKPYNKAEWSKHTKGAPRRSFPLQSGMYKLTPYDVPRVDTDEPLPREPLSTLVMRFVYRRFIKPRFWTPKPGENDPGTVADNAVGEVNKVLSGIGFDLNAFIKDLEEENIPLNAYYHPSQFRDYMGGGVESEGLSEFIRKQQAENQGKPPIFGIDPKRFYAEHVRKEKVPFTKQNKNGRTFSNNEANDLKYDSYILRAIANKMRQGFALNEKVLDNLIKQRKDRYTTLLRTTEKQMPGFEDKYAQMKQHILGEYNKGMMLRTIKESPEASEDQNIQAKQVRSEITSKLPLLTQSSEYDKMRIIKRLVKIAAPKNDYHWGVELTGDRDNILAYRQGLDISGAKKYIKSTLTTEELRILLSSLTAGAWDYFKKNEEGWSDEHLEWFKHTYLNWTKLDAQTYQTGPEQFFVPGFSLQFSSNGLDSDPTSKTGKKMPVIPTIRKLPDSDVNKDRPQELYVYDRDTGNMGRNHLVKNWYKVAGQSTDIAGNSIPKKEECLLKVFKIWGQKCAKALETLSGLDPEAPFGGSRDPNMQSTANTAWKIVIPNRTNAETAYEEIISKYNDYRALDAEILSNPLSSVLNIYYEYANQPAPDLSDPIVVAVHQYQRDGDWKSFSQKARQYLIDNDKIKKTDQDTKIDQAGFRLYQQYGYPIAKMMDFLSCLMHASCGEKWKRQADLRIRDPRLREGKRREDLIFGRHYSTSSGKGSGGQIMIGIHYAFNAGELVANIDDPSLSPQQREEAIKVRKMINQERGRRHDAYRIKGNTYRRSSLHENSGIKTIVDNKGNEIQLGAHEPLHGAPRQDVAEYQDYLVGEKLREGDKPTGLKVRTVKVIEQLEYFIGEAGSADGMIQGLYRDASWSKVLDQFLTRFPTLEGQLGVIISPLNARFDILELSAKKAIDAVREQIEADPPVDPTGQEGKAIFEIVLEQANGNISVMSTDEIDNEAVSLDKELEQIKKSDNRETMSMPKDLLNTKPSDESLRTPIPVEQAPVPTAPVPTPQGELAVPEEASDGLIPIPDLSGTNQPPAPKSPKVPPTTPTKKPMETSPLDSMKNFVSKNKPKRSLFRDKGTHASLSNTLIKIADEFDHRGLPLLADKIDFLVRKIEGLQHVN